MKHLNIFINEKLYIRKNKRGELSEDIANLLIKNLIDINKVNHNSFAISKSRFKSIDSYLYILYRDKYLSNNITFEDLNIDIFDDIVDIKCTEATGFHKTLYKKIYTVSNIEQQINTKAKGVFDSDRAVRRIRRRPWRWQILGRARKGAPDGAEVAGHQAADRPTHVA